MVDTGASRSCINEHTYHNLNLPKVSELSDVRVSSATGTPIEVLGTVECTITLGKCKYKHKFIVCRNIKRAMILGLDFLRKFRIQTGWASDGGFQIVAPNQETVEAIRVYHRGPTVKLKHQTILPPRSLVVLKGTTTLTPKHRKRYYELTPNPHLKNEYPNLIMYPMIHHPDVCGEVEVPVCMVNLDQNPIKLIESKTIGLMKRGRCNRERNYHRNSTRSYM